MATTKRPAVRGAIPREAVFAFVRALGVEPKDVLGFRADPYRVSVEVYYRDAEGLKMATPDGERVTYRITREIR